MKLNEIKKIPKQSDDNPFDISAIGKLERYKNANVEGNELLFSQHGDEFFFIVKVDGIMVAFLKATEVKEPVKALQINRTFVIPSFRNKGYITALYRTLRGNGNKIISDIELSPESLSVWKKLSSYYSINVIDAKTGKELRKISDADFIKPNNENERLMIEEYMSFGKPVIECGFGLISETGIFLGTDTP